MEQFITYIGLSGICIGIFYLIYRIFLRSCTNFGFNRGFLLTGLVVSFILPALRFSYEVALPVSAFTITESSATQTGTPDNTAVDINIWLLLSIVYIAGIILQLVRNVASYRKILKLIKSGILTKTDRYKIIDNPQIASPFTVLNCIGINTANITETEKDIILKHEITHISQKHWIDLLCSECALLLQWFNPLMWLYVFVLKENHEFLADKAVIDAGVSPAVYQAALINQRFQGPVFSFSNSFNYPNQLNRLFMIKKAKTSPWRRAAVLALIPLFGLFFWASATPRYVFKTIESEPIGQMQDSVKVVGFKADSKGVMQIIGNTTDPTNDDRHPLTGKELYIIDGKESSYAAVNKLSPDDIESISVLKNESAIETYGAKGKNGVILVRTVNAPKNISITPPVMTKDPLIIIDNKESNKAELDKIDPSTIYNVTILKDESATGTYGEKGKDGVMVITMKKGIAPPPPPLPPGKSGDFRLVADSIIINSTQDGLILHNAKVSAPMIILDGKEISGETLQAISPDKIDKIDVWKGDDAIQKYGEKGQDGVIIVTSKK